jgi:hypothetical protein
MNEKRSFLKLLAAIFAAYIFCEKVIVDTVFLAAKGPHDTRSIKALSELLDNDFNVFAHFVASNFEEDMPKIFQILAPQQINPETAINYIFLSSFFDGLSEGKNFAEHEKQLLDFKVEEIRSDILKRDPNLRRLQKIFERVSINFDDPRVKVANVYPTWIISTSKGRVILEGFKGDLLRYLNLKEKTLDIEKLKQDLN